MAGLSIIIPSRNISNLTACVAAIRKAGETERVVVIDDGLERGSLLDLVGPIRFADGVKPFCFARNVNIGIRAAGRDDILLLNDDALLTDDSKTFGALVDECEFVDNQKFGIVAASTNVTGYPIQWRHQKRILVPSEGRFRQYGAHEIREATVVNFCAVLIPRRTIDTVGLLDERFVTYGGDDVDYCLRVREAGMKVGVSDFCYVDHSKLQSTFRGAHPKNSAPGDITESNRIGREKWGDRWPHR